MTPLVRFMGGPADGMLISPDVLSLHEELPKQLGLIGIFTHVILCTSGDIQQLPLDPNWSLGASWYIRKPNTGSKVVYKYDEAKDDDGA